MRRPGRGEEDHADRNDHAEHRLQAHGLSADLYLGRSFEALAGLVFDRHDRFGVAELNGITKAINIDLRPTTPEASTPFESCPAGLNRPDRLVRERDGRESCRRCPRRTVPGRSTPTAARSKRRVRELRSESNPGSTGGQPGIADAVGNVRGVDNDPVVLEPTAREPRHQHARCSAGRTTRRRGPGRTCPSATSCECRDTPWYHGSTIGRVPTSVRVRPRSARGIAAAESCLLGEARGDRAAGSGAARQGTVCLPPISRSFPPSPAASFSSSFSDVTATRVMVSSVLGMGSMLTAGHASCTGPRTCPAGWSPVDITAPKVRTSKNLAHRTSAARVDPPVRASRPP